MSLMKDNLIQKKSFDFAIRIVKAFKYLKESKSEYVLSKQLLRCGTSIDANIEEAIGAQSKPDFISKLTIAYKEARETLYWLKLLMATDFLETKIGNSLLRDAEELCKIIASIQISTKAKMP